MNAMTLIEISEHEPLTIKPNFISVEDLMLRRSTRRFLVDFVGQVVSFKQEESPERTLVRLKDKADLEIVLVVPKEVNLANWKQE